MIELENTKTEKKPELTTGEKWVIKKVNGENAQATGFLHTIIEITGPYDYLYQSIKQMSTMKKEARAVKVRVLGDQQR